MEEELILWSGSFGCEYLLAWIGGTPEARLAIAAQEAFLCQRLLRTCVRMRIFSSRTV